MTRLILIIMLCCRAYIGNTDAIARGQSKIGARGDTINCNAATYKKVYRYPRDESVDTDYLKLTVSGPPSCMPSEGGDSSQLMIQKYDGKQWAKPYGPIAWKSAAQISEEKSVYTIRLVPTLFDRGQNRMMIVDGAGKELVASNPFVLK